MKFRAIRPGRVAQPFVRLTRAWFDTRPGKLLPFLLALVQEGQLSVSGERMLTCRIGGLIYSIKGLSFGSKDYIKELKTFECKSFLDQF